MALKNQKGAAAVEFAIVLPLLVSLVFGIIDFGLLLNNKQVITNASREGARTGIVNRDPMFRFQTGDPVDVSNVVSNWLGDRLVTFGDTDEAEIVVEIWDNAAGDFDEVNDINPDDRCKIFRCPLRVRVTYDYEFLVLSMFGFGPITLDATSRMRME